MSLLVYLNFLVVFGYELSNFGFCVGMIPVFGVAFRILTLVMLYQLPDDSWLNIALMYVRYFSQWENCKILLKKVWARIKKQVENKQ